VTLAFDLKAGWLLDVDFLLQLSIQKGGLNVHVVDSPPFSSSMRQQQPNRLQPGHRRENLVEVDPWRWM
jgi:hypothetical protein